MVDLSPLFYGKVIPHPLGFFTPLPFLKKTFF
jgi:hypothetical protein